MTATNGIISQPSSYSVTETINRLEAVLQAKGIKIFARIDQQVEAEKVGSSLRLTQLLFGNPKVGTPLMVAEPTIALDLPLKVLAAWEATNGKVWLSYNDPNSLKQRFSLSDNLIENIAVIALLIHQALL